MAMQSILLDSFHLVDCVGSQIYIVSHHPTTFLAHKVNPRVLHAIAVAYTGAGLSLAL